MPKRKEKFEPNLAYHVFNRGTNKQPIFFCDENYSYLLKKIRKYESHDQIKILACCLMPNHYHFVLVPTHIIPTISHFIGHVFNGYVQAVNHKHNRTGPLFEGRFKHRLIKKPEHVLHVCRYIHLNPLRAGLVETLDTFNWSDYLDWVGKRPSQLKKVEFRRDYFTDPNDYAKFVHDRADELKYRDQITEYFKF